MNILKGLTKDKKEEGVAEPGGGELPPKHSKFKFPFFPKTATPEQYKATATDPKDQLIVIPIEARNLPVGDPIAGRSDPYCVVNYAGHNMKTKIIPYTIHPVWGSSVFTFDVDPNAKELLLEVWDYDKGKSDDFLGQAILPLNAAGVMDLWLELTPSTEQKSKRTYKASGKIHVRVYYKVPPPTSQEEALGKSLFLFEDFQFREKLKTGDAILFSGSEFVSGVIKKFMHTPYSHCGMVVRMKDPTKTKNVEEQKEEIFVVEADWDDGDYFGKDEPVYGVAINLFEERMKAYSGDVIWLCPLKNALTPEQEQKVREYVLTSKNSKVKYDMFQGLKMMMCMKNKECSSSVFCSELVAFSLKKAGVVPENVNCSEQDPFEVSKFECFDSGAYPFTVLRYQTQVDQEKVNASGMQEMMDLLKPAKKAQKVEPPKA